MSGELILVVDGAPASLRLTRMILVHEGYGVLTASNVEEAREALRNSRPNLVLVDLPLPGADGLQLTRRIKQDRRTRETAVIAVTAFDADGGEQSAIEAGCDGLLIKPVDTRALLDKIQECLDRQAQREEPAADEAPETPNALAPACPNCGSRDTRRSLTHPLLHRLLAWTGATYRCRACRQLFLVRGKKAQRNSR